MGGNEIQVHYVPKPIEVFCTIIDNHVELNKYLKEVILEHRKNKPESNTSNVQAWHSEYLTHLVNPKFQPLIDQVMGAIRFISDGFYDRRDIQYEVVNLWAMMYEDEEFTKRHNHWPDEFGVCYYVDVEPNCAPVIFESIQDDGVNDKNKPLVIHPKNGMLLIWPGILEHEVPSTKGKRMAISMNIDKLYRGFNEDTINKIKEKYNGKKT
jgi:hypothetical protein|tara:strand:- start:492 stop:1121 length:630 start_codon:yes stop_codon:yes gene_type:complete